MGGDVYAYAMDNTLSYKLASVPGTIASCLCFAGFPPLPMMLMPQRRRQTLREDVHYS